MPYAQINDCKLYYEESGSVDNGDPIIFLHGFTLDHRQWGPQALFFGQLNLKPKQYHPIILDSRGHGLSDAPKTGYSRAHRVKDLAEFADKLKIERFHLVGLSMGGTTAIGFALNHQHRLKSLSLVSSAVAGLGIGKKIVHIDKIVREKGLEVARKRWKKMTLSFYNEDQVELAQLMTTMVDEHSGATWMDPMRGKYEREYDMPRLGQITIPTAIFCGQIDQVFHKIGRQLHQSIHKSQFFSYPGVGHIVNHEIPTKFNADLKAFLEGVE